MDGMRGNADSMAKTLKPVAFTCILLIAGGGRLFNLTIVRAAPFGYSIAAALLVGFTFGLFGMPCQ